MHSLALRASMAEVHIYPNLLILSVVPLRFKKRAISSRDWPKMGLLMELWSNVSKSGQIVNDHRPVGRTDLHLAAAILNRREQFNKC